MANALAILAGMAFGVLAVPDLITLASFGDGGARAVWSALVVLHLAVTAAVGILLVAGQGARIRRGRR